MYQVHHYVPVDVKKDQPREPMDGDHSGGNITQEFLKAATGAILHTQGAPNSLHFTEVRHQGLQKVIRERL